MKFLLATAIVYTAWLLPLAMAQFQFFENMFGHQQQQQQQHRGGSASQWAAQADQISCSTYLCPDTLACVTSPSECPCPSVEDERCLIPDALNRDAATVLCVRGGRGCADVERLMKKWK